MKNFFLKVIHKVFGYGHCRHCGGRIWSSCRLYRRCCWELGCLEKERQACDTAYAHAAWESIPVEARSMFALEMAAPEIAVTGIQYRLDVEKASQSLRSVCGSEGIFNLAYKSAQRKAQNSQSGLDFWLAEEARYIAMRGIRYLTDGPKTADEPG